MSLPTGVIPVDKGRHINIVDYHIQISVVIQITIDGTVGMGGCRKTPFFGLLGKCKVPVVMKGIVGDPF